MRIGYITEAIKRRVYSAITAEILHKRGIVNQETDKNKNLWFSSNHVVFIEDNDVQYLLLDRDDAQDLSHDILSDIDRVSEYIKNEIDDCYEELYAEIQEGCGYRIECVVNPRYTDRDKQKIDGVIISTRVYV